MNPDEAAALALHPSGRCEDGEAARDAADFLRREFPACISNQGNASPATLRRVSWWVQGSRGIRGPLERTCIFSLLSFALAEANPLTVLRQFIMKLDGQDKQAQLASSVGENPVSNNAIRTN